MTSNQRENYVSEKHENFDNAKAQEMVQIKILTNKPEKSCSPAREKTLLLNLPEPNNKTRHAARNEYTDGIIENFCEAVANASLSPTPRTSQQCPMVSHVFPGPTWGSAPCSMLEGGGVEPRQSPCDVRLLLGF